MFDKKLTVRDRKERGVIYIPKEFIGFCARVTIDTIDVIKIRPSEPRKLDRCIACNKKLQGRQRKYCSEKCKIIKFERICKSCGRRCYGFRCKECIAKRGTSLSRRK